MTRQLNDVRSSFDGLYPVHQDEQVPSGKNAYFTVIMRVWHPQLEWAARIRHGR